MTDRRNVLVLLVVAALVLSSPGAGQGASVFMKNGYIIQGPVVERDEETFVLGWPNGKVFLSRRFVESISYDPGEEKRLEDDERRRKEELVSSAERPDYMAPASEAVELPSTLEELMRNYDMPMRRTPAPPPAGGLASDAGDVPDPLSEIPGIGPDFPTLTPGDTATDEPGIPAAVLTLAEEELGERISDASTSISFRPPKGWDVRSTDAAFAVVGPPGPDGFRPSLNVVFFARGELSGADYTSLLQQENEAELEAYESLHQGYRDVGLNRAMEIVGRGSFGGRTAYVRQLLVVDEDHAWLVSAFTADHGSDDRLYALTERSLDTLEFGSP